MTINWQRRPIVCGGLLVLLTLVAYMPALLRGGFVWDDDFHVTDNPLLRSTDGLVRIWTEPGATPQYYPLVHTTFWCEYQLWELNPFGYHLVNVLLHTLNALLLWRLLAGLNVRGAWLAAALFAVHPVNVESVAWISERNNVLSGAFYLMAAIAFVEFWMWGNRGRRWFSYMVAFVLFLCALLSKMVTCTLPVALLIVWWWKRGRVTWRAAWMLMPFFVVGAALGAATMWLERYRVGAMGGEWSLSFVERYLIAGRAVSFYAQKIVWPHPLSFIYERWQIVASVWWQWAFPVGVVVAMATLWALRRRIGRGALAAALVFVASLGPALGSVNLLPFRYSFVADHFQYLAGIAVVALIATRLPRWGAAPLLGVLVALTWQQSRVYESSETLWRDVVTKNPACWMAQNNLGLALARQGKTEDAAACYGEALRLKPGFADPCVNLGNLFAEQHDDPLAVAAYRLALVAEPGHFSARHNLALALGRLGLADDSIEQYRLVLQLNPEFADAHYNLGVALARRGELQEAHEHFAEALRLRPDFEAARHNLRVAEIKLAALTDS